MIKQLREMNIEQNPIVKVQEEQIKNLQKELKNYENPTPVQFPGYNTDGLESLLELRRKFEIIEVRPYTERINPLRKFGKWGKES